MFLMWVDGLDPRLQSAVTKPKGRTRMSGLCLVLAVFNKADKNVQAPTFSFYYDHLIWKFKYSHSAGGSLEQKLCKGRMNHQKTHW